MPSSMAAWAAFYLEKRDFPAAEKELKTALQLDRNNLNYWKDLSSTFYLAGITRPPCPHST